MIRLGLRLIAAGGRSSVVTVGLTALAVAFGTSILLFALSFEPAAGTRYNHAAWRDTPGRLDLQTATEGLMLARTDDHVAGRRLIRMDVAALSPDAPVPPGIDVVPAPGETYVSPALAALMASMPVDQLAARFGTVVGTIEDGGLMAPDELAAIVGRAPDDLRTEGARVVEVLNGTRAIPVPTNPLIRILVLITVIGALAPVAVFVASATRLAAARREQRLAALRLAGATPGQVTRLAAVEALVATIPGALGGVLLFLLLRPAVAMVPLAQATWFEASIVPPLLPAVALLLLVQVVGVVAAVVALRRVQVTPLGVRRRERRRPLRKLRLLPLLLSLGVFGFGVATFAANQQSADESLLLILGVGFFGIIVSIAIAGPWITAVVGALLTRIARGPVPLLAGRRLNDEPRGAFGAIGGVVMAVFVGSAYLSIAAFATAASPVEERLAVRADVLMASVPGNSPHAADAVIRLGSVDGVQAVAEIREVAVGDPSEVAQLGVVADCTSLVAVLSAPSLTCGDGLLHLGPGGEPVTDATVYSARFLGGYSIGYGSVEEVPFRIDASKVDRYAPAGLAPEARLALPALIIDPRAFPGGVDAFPVTRIAILTDGDPAAIERARTAVQVMLPTSVVRTVGEAATDAAALVTELGRVVSLGVIVAMLLAGASLAIAVISGLVERRTPFALLRLAGMPLAKLRAVLVLEAAAPLVAVAALSAVLGMLVAQLLIRSIRTIEVPLPDLGVAALLAVATLGAIGVVLAAMPMVGRITGAEANRFE